MTEKSLINIYHVEQHGNITISLQQSLCSAFFQTLINLNVHTGMAVNHTLMTVSTMSTKDLMQMANFLIYILNINILFWHCKNIRLLLNINIPRSVNKHQPSLEIWHTSLQFCHSENTFVIPVDVPLCAHCRLALTCHHLQYSHRVTTLIARFMGPTWGPSGADRTQGSINGL